MRRFIYIISLLSLFSCGKDPVQTSTSLMDTISNTKYYNKEILSDSNLKLYGQWQFLYIFADAGIIEGPGKIPSTYDYLEIKKYGIYGMIKNNKVIESGKIQIIKQDSKLFEMSFYSDKNINDLYPSSIWYVNYIGNDSLEMVDASVGCGVLYNVYKKRK